jgi:hypothetical protein
MALPAKVVTTGLFYLLEKENARRINDLGLENA